MYKHYIIIGSSYLKKKRIALHYVLRDISMLKVIQEDVKKIERECGKDIGISTHIVTTDNHMWKSVYESDPFFEDIKVVDNVDEFIELIKKDKILKGRDVANYILTKGEYTHIQLQKLTYLCYVEYLCKYGKKMFNDKIYAFRYGPVVDSIYKKYKNEKGKLSVDKKRELAIRSRLMNSIDGIEKIECIDETLKKYSKFDFRVLIKITHAKNSAWSKVYDKDRKFNIMSDELILKSYKEKYRKN